MMTRREAALRGPVDGLPILSGLPTPSPHPDYVQTEWLLAGTACSFRAGPGNGDDGRWTAAPGDGADYLTRLVVRRPADPARHNGAVVVEWLNVSMGVDAGPFWGLTHRHLTRAGYAWVGVSVQRVGVEGGGPVPGQALKVAAADRYAGLHHPGDAWAFGMFAQAGAAVRAHAADLVGSDISHVLAAGVSQSAGFLVTYVNAVDPLEPVFDGFLVHGRAGRAASLEGWVVPPGSIGPGWHRVMADGRTRVREDARVPVFVVQSETDVLTMGGLNARQVDGDYFRCWEVAGSAHADTYLLVASRLHDDTTTPEELADACAPTTMPLGRMLPCELPINSGPQLHYVTQSALEHLLRWVRDGVAPPQAPPLVAAPDGAAFVGDGLGIASGGVRTGWVDVPAAVLSGQGQRGPTFAFLFGTTIALEPGVLASRYPDGREDYRERFAGVTRAAAEAGFVLADDVEECVALAAAMYPSEPDLRR